MAHDIRPTVGELSEARSVIDVTLDAAERELEDSPSPIHVGVGWAADLPTVESFGGALSVCHDPERLTVQFTTTVDEWTDAVMTATARGMGRAWLRGRLPDQRLAFRWQVIVVEAAGIALAERIAPAVEAPWSSKVTLEEHWEGLAETLSDGVGTAEPIGDDDTLAYPLASLGVQLAAAISLEDLPGLTRTDVETALSERFEDA